MNKSENIKEIEYNELQGIIIDSLTFLYKRDMILLVNNVNERSICHQLAQYIKGRLRNWDVDVEYNRIENASKFIYVKKNEIKRAKSFINKYFQNMYDVNAYFSSKSNIELDELDEKIKVLVAPDIIIHKRFTQNNLLAIEVKKTKNKNIIEKEYDLLKLLKYTD